MRIFSRMMAVLVFVVGWAVWGPAAANACACGAVISDTGVGIDAETSLILFDGQSETIEMMMRLDGAAKDAAWIMPAPKGTEVSLGKKDTFFNLAEETKPEVVIREDWWPVLPGSGVGAGLDGAQGAPGVAVEKTETVGPFKVTTLSGTDAKAVSEWLVEHGYPARDDLHPSFQTYLDQDWRILAVKLTPTAAAQEFVNNLDPLRLTFATTEAVYPILLSQHAKQNQEVLLYIAADHRYAITTEASRTQPLKLRFAGKISGDKFGHPGSEYYVTSYFGSLDPDKISDDYRFAQDGTDETYRQVIYRTVYRGDTTLAIFMVTGSVILIGGVVAGIWLYLRAARKKSSSLPK